MIAASFDRTPAKQDRPSRNVPSEFDPPDGGNPAGFSRCKTTMKSAAAFANTETIRPRSADDCNVERDVQVWISMMLLILVVPAVLGLMYIVFNSDALMQDIIPKYNFSSWEYGEPLTPREN